MQVFLLCHEARTELVAPESFVGCAPCAADALALHNNVAAPCKETKRHAGHWIVALTIDLPEWRRLDERLLRNFLHERARKLYRRVILGIAVARALQLPCIADPALLSNVRQLKPTARTAREAELGVWTVAEPRDDVDALNTLANQRFLRAGDSVCFTRRDEASNRGARTKATEAGASFARVTPDELIGLIEAGDASAGRARNPLLRAAQATALETTLYSADESAKRGALTVIGALPPMSPRNPLARIARGTAPYDALRDNVSEVCASADGAVDDRLLARRGDCCYGDANEFLERSLRRVPLHWRERCASCNSHGTLRSVVRVRGSERTALRCTACGRTTRTATCYRTDLDELKRALGEQSDEQSAREALAADADDLSFEECARQMMARIPIEPVSKRRALLPTSVSRTLAAFK